MTQKYNQGGLAPYGLRHSGEGVKGKGYFGPMAGRDGTVTELSAEDESGEFPLVVPTLTAEELDRLLAGGEPTPEMLDKASSWAATRRKRGESPFASPTEVRMPRPKAEGGAANLTDLPDEVNPSNWREHLQNNVLADARALLGVKDGGAISLDDLIEQALKKKDGGAINLNDLIDWTLAKHEHRKMKEGGAVKMADGGQTFPLQRPEEVTDLKPRPRTKRDELLEMLSKGVGSVHEFMAKPFGYENPPGEMVSSLIGLPGAAKTLERMAYGDPLTSGAGMTTNLLPETTEAAFLGLGAAPTALKLTKNLPVGMSIKPTTTDLLDLELANKMKASPIAVVPEAKAGKVKAPANPVGFYNPAEKAALNLQRKKGPGSAFISDLKKQPGVTDERIAELGLTDLASNPNVTREDVIATVEQNRIPLRESVRSESSGDAMFSPSAYPDYNMPGGENYREIRVGLPLENNQEIKVVPHPTKEGYALQYPSGRFVGRADAPDRIGTTDPNFANNWTSVEAAKEYGVPFHSSAFMHRTHHGDEPNVLFHLRVADHVDEEGKRGLLIDELQSDWHQTGREKGYKGEVAAKAEKEFKQYSQELADKYDLNPQQNLAMYASMKKMSPDEVAKYEQLQSKWASSKQGVPDAPFKDNWYQVGLKRAIKEAVDTGMDRVYLTTGARQADRYDLSKKVDAIQYHPENKALVVMKDGDIVIAETGASEERIKELVGKEAAKKLLEQESVTAPNKKYGETAKVLSGLDLRIGGEGMKQYYDKNYKNYLEKYAKQHGGKLGMTNILTKSPKDLEIYKNYLSNTYGKDSEAYKLMLKEVSEPVYYIDLTDAMRESAKKGQSYADGGGVFNTDPDITDAGRIIPEHTI